MTTEDRLERAEKLLARLQAARGRLETTSDADAAAEILAELAAIARDVEVELDQARREADDLG